MATIYRVDYSDKTGFYVEVIDNVYGHPDGWVSRDFGDDVFTPQDGWRISEDEAVEIWRSDTSKAADDFRTLAYSLENMACGPAPTVPVRIMKPALP